MTLPNGNSIWKLLIAVLALVFFFCVGIAHVFYPDRFLKRSGLHKGGEMLTEFNRIGFQIAGIIFAAFAACLLYVLISDLFVK